MAWSLWVNQALVCPLPVAISSANNCLTLKHTDSGKSCFLSYVLFRLLSLEKNVAFQLDDQFILFQNTGVRISSANSSSGRCLPYRIWALSDSHRDFVQPCHAFLTACGARRAWVVQTSSPLEHNWRDWSEQNYAGMYCMDIFTLDEMNTLW